MATFRLATILITDPVDGAFSADDELIIMWDDVAEDFSLTLNGAPFSTAGTLLGFPGQNYTIIIGVSSSEGGYSIAGYSFCDGDDLVWFRMLSDFPQYPFFEKRITVDSPVCDVGGGAVCDIQFVGPFIINHSVDKSTGGSIQFEVASSNGTVKYGLRDFDYATGGTVAIAGLNTISGIIPGNWTLYIKDANDCTAQRSFKMLFKPTEAEHYRFSWRTVPLGHLAIICDARLRIYEREYVGDLVEIDRGEESPFKLNKPRVQGHLNDKLFPIHPTSALLSLYSQQDYQFLPLFTQDNKKYRCVYEINTGSGFVEIWQGFIEPSIYREDFISVPYIVSIEITDNVRTLEQEKFTDDDGNLLNGSLKLIKVLNHVMKRTGLNLKIRSGINIFEANHNTAASDDPLDQTYIDVACYRKGTEPFSCWDVLEAILRPFGARIVLDNNQWLITEIDRAYQGYAYRVFDTSGNYESNGTESADDIIVDVKGSSYTDRAAMLDEDQSMEVIPAYGKIDVKSVLNYIGSVVAGGFEKTDLLSPESEEFNIQQGVYTSEEGFNGWTLRLNGTNGVSFGRVLVSNRGDNARTGLQGDEDLIRSVGAFYFSPNAWSGNLRNAYIESAAKPYQYGPGDELKFFFEYSTPARPEYEFMVLRMMIKVGNQYLQQDISWDTAEYIFRAYPRVSNSLQKFELSIPVPDTDVVVDSTVQTRIYYYAAGFYDYGLPSSTSDPADGTDGVSGLKGLVTAGLDVDYQVDIRREFTIGAFDAFFREFFELLVASTAEDVNGGIIRPNDFNSSTNPKIWWRMKSINIKNETDQRRRGVDLKFYVDNVALDALINGQPPPEEDLISLQISKYINESLEVPLYNFDVPDIVNAKNMYNNYFRLADGTPTSLWGRSGINESLPIQKILLKVLGANHSAPTFRITGTFGNEFQRIGFKNYLRITKPGSSLAAINTEFTSNLSGWEQSALPLLTGTWAWTADNSGSAEVTLSGSSADSKKIYQAISHKGGYIRLTVNLKGLPAVGNTREDVLYVIFYNGAKIIHTEKMVTFGGLTSDTSYDFTYIAFAPGQVTHIGFYIRNVAGAGDCEYQVSQFKPEGTDIQEVYQISDYRSEESENVYSLELMQQSKSFISLGGIDAGGNNQSGSETGREHSSAYSSAYS